MRTFWESIDATYDDTTAPATVRWPMNESVICFSASADRVQAWLPVDAFPDGVGLCTVLKGVTCADPASGCPACVANKRGTESPRDFAIRLYDFCDRICERMVAHEDKFIAGFNT